jgi:TM2 domain-containing membrane protein YozV
MASPITAAGGFLPGYMTTEEATMIHVRCPRCQTRFTTSDANAGKTGQCPKCGNPIKVQPLTPSRPPGGSAPAPADQDTDAPPTEAVSDSALGAARRHAAQAAAGGAAQPPAPAARPAPQPHRAVQPPAETQPKPAKEAPETAAPPPEAPAAEEPAAQTAPIQEGKSKTVALVLCIFLGAIGTHRFYMGSWGWGLVIMGLNLTCIGGAIFALVDIIRLAVMDKADFQERYGERVVRPFTF